jgi:hypothetical protein
MISYQCEIAERGIIGALDFHLLLLRSHYTALATELQKESLKWLL